MSRITRSRLQAHCLPIHVSQPSSSDELLSQRSTPSETRSSARERVPSRRWSNKVSKYPQGPPITGEEELHATIDAANISARALVAADDILVRLFDNPRVRLRVRTVGKGNRGLPIRDGALLKRSFDAAFKAGMGYPQWRANKFTEQMQSHGLVERNEEDAEAFSNLSLRYARLKYSPRVKVSDVAMNGRVESCIVATSRIPKGTLILELGGLMSSDTIEVFAGSHGYPKRKHATQTPFEMFSVIWRSREQCGPGPRTDRLLLGPARFVNHSCASNCKLRPFPGTNAWGIESFKEILPDEEITIDYGSRYFAPGECACAPCQAKKPDTPATPSTSVEASPSPYTPFAELKRDPQSSIKRRLTMDQDREIEDSTPRSKKARIRR